MDVEAINKMDAGGDRNIPALPSNIAVIQEVYDNEFAHQSFAAELERALEANCSIIVIEPTQLGEETARWIYVGNCLHKTAIITGVTSLFGGLIFYNKPITYIPAGIISFLSSVLYTASWQFDSCVKYQQVRDPKQLSRLQFSNIIPEGSSPVVLARQDDGFRKVVHCSISLAAASLCALKLYQLMK